MSRVKVLHIAKYFLPTTTGGIETYIYRLSKELQELGIASTVGIPASEVGHDYECDGIRVLALPDDPVSLSEYLRRLAHPILHQHSCMPPVGRDHLVAARAVGMQTVLTIHEPQPFCARTTLLQNGRTECDGHISAEDCTRCLLSEAPWLANVATRVPPAVASAMYGIPKLGPLRRIAHKAIPVAKQKYLSDLFGSASRVIAISRWLEKACLMNGCDPSRLELIPNAISPPSIQRRGEQQRPGDELVVGFVGRASPLKGIELIAQAVSDIPDDVRVRLIVHAAVNAEAGHYGQSLLRLANARVEIRSGLGNDDALRFMQDVDVIAVPSQWKECAPLVVLEALSVGTPVLGSNLGAIREQIRDGFDGLLLPHDEPRAWSRAIVELARAPDKLDSLRQSVRRPTRTMKTIALEMEQIYRALAANADSSTIA